MLGDILKRCEYTPYGLKEKSVVDVKNAIKSDHSISMIPEDEYDAILIHDGYSHIQKGISTGGFIFGDKSNRFPDGANVFTSSVQEIATPIDGLKLVKTRNTTYLTVI